MTNHPYAIVHRDLPETAIALFTEKAHAALFWKALTRETGASLSTWQITDVHS